MELVTDENIQKYTEGNSNEFSQDMYNSQYEDEGEEVIYHNSGNNTFSNSNNINEIRDNMNIKKIINFESNPLLTEICKNNISSKEIESLDSDNYGLVMSQDYNYNPKTSSINSLEKYPEIIGQNFLYNSQKEFNDYNPHNNNDYQYYSEQKIFNPSNILFDISTKKSTRSTISKSKLPEKSGNKSEIKINNNDENIENQNNNNHIVINNNERSSLTKMVNEYYENNENDNDEKINDNKMTMNSFDSSQNHFKNNNKKINKSEKEEENEEEKKEEENNHISLKEKSLISEKMNLDNQEICNLLNEDNKIESNNNIINNINNNINNESQSSNYYIESKNKNFKNEQQNSKNSTKNNKLSQKKRDEKIVPKKINNKIKKDEKKFSKTNKQEKIIEKSNTNNKKIILEKNKINKYENNNNCSMTKMNLNEKIPFQGNYIDYKKYEKNILESNNDELLNTGNEEDAFGSYIDSIIEKSYHMYTNRQCPTCANLLTKGKSCAQCPKYHHIIKSGKNKKK